MEAHKKRKKKKKSVYGDKKIDISNIGKEEIK